MSAKVIDLVIRCARGGKPSAEHRGRPMEIDRHEYEARVEQDGTIRFRVRFDELVLGPSDVRMFQRDITQLAGWQTAVIERLSCVTQWRWEPWSEPDTFLVKYRYEERVFVPVKVRGKVKGSWRCVPCQRVIQPGETAWRVRGRDERWGHVRICDTCIRRPAEVR